jgi:hypothetical protein
MVAHRSNTSVAIQAVLVTGAELCDSFGNRVVAG